VFLQTAKAQSYPSKPIRLVVPFAPGGSSSLVARVMSAEMEKGLGKPFVIENKPGGGGNIAMQEVARADPDGYTLIIGHVGSLAMEYLKQVAGIELQHVPYKGTGPNVTDLIAGRTQASSAGTPPLMPHVKAGKLRVIAVGTSKRLHSIPDVPTVAEQGYPGFETSQWYGLNAPAKTPPAIVKRLADEAAKAAKSPAVLQRYAADDAES